MFLRSLLMSVVAAFAFNAPLSAATNDDPPTVSLSVIPQPAGGSLGMNGGVFEAPAGIEGGLARWSIIFSYALNDCVGLDPSCTVMLYVDGNLDDGTDDGVDVLGTINVLSHFGNSPSKTGIEWNMLNSPLNGLTGFSPLFEGSLDFTLRIENWRVSDDPTSADVMVDIVASNGVPEPGTLALIGLALVSGAMVGRRTRKT